LGARGYFGLERQRCRRGNRGVHPRPRRDGTSRNLADAAAGGIGPTRPAEARFAIPGECQWTLC
jgi:hypothetical protein